MIPIEIKEVQGGLQMIYHFSNGYGASVIQHEGSYGGLSSKWELAVITNFSVENIDENVQFDITYDTPITEDVLGHLTWSEVIHQLNKINRLQSIQNMV